MSIMEWDSTLDVGVEAMNLQHKKILELMNRLHSAVEAKSEFSKQLFLLDQLANITIIHFKAEEQFMKQAGFPGFEGHKLIHEQLLEKFKAHVNVIKQKEQIGHDFFGFLKIWLSAHIKGIDKKYGDFANDKVA